MRSRSALIATVLLVLVPFAIPASAREYLATCVRFDRPPCGPGRLEASFGAKLAPRLLPSRELVPIGVEVQGTVKSQNDGHPPALREAIVAVEQGITIDTEGLATCARRRLERLDMARARRACRKAIVGHGVARVGLASSGGVLRAPLTLFNGGTSAGVTRLFVHSAAGMLGGPLVAAAQIRQRGKGLEAIWKIPRILEGDGSLLSFRFEVRRSFAAAGRRRSYLAGRCPDGELRVSASSLVFVNETHAPGIASWTLLRGGLLVPCGPKR